MSKLLQKMVLSAFLLLLIPLTAFALSWKWHPAIFQTDLKLLFWLTETASAPWALISCFLLLLVFIWKLKVRSLKNIIKLTVILASSVIVGQGIKTVVKSTLEEPRPFVMWLEEAHGIDDEYFYSLPRKERAALIETIIKNDASVPQWGKSHWKNETGYSLPSGHTIFSACWALLFVGFFNFKKHYLLVSAAVLWAGGISFSRLILGMHWPLDLVGGILVALMVAIGAVFWAKRWDLLPAQD